MRAGSNRAIVIRQGPTNVFCTIAWDLRRDTLAVGQWCKHKLYPWRCDVSADGKWLVYFALNGRWKSETLGAWTGLSLAPYLRAVKLWPLGNTWGGGGLFHDRRELPPSAKPWYVVDDRNVLWGGGYTARLERDGWQLLAGDKKGDKTFAKALSGGWLLRKRLGKEPRERYQLVDPAGRASALPGWEWADLDARRGRVVWAEGGALRAARSGKQGLGDATVLFDATPMKFEPIRAPYDLRDNDR